MLALWPLERAPTAGDTWAGPASLGPHHLGHSNVWSQQEVLQLHQSSGAVATWKIRVLPWHCMERAQTLAKLFWKYSLKKKLKKAAAVGVQSFHSYKKIQWHREFPQSKGFPQPIVGTTVIELLTSYSTGCWFNQKAMPIIYTFCIPSTAAQTNKNSTFKNTYILLLYGIFLRVI